MLVLLVMWGATLYVLWQCGDGAHQRFFVHTKHDRRERIIKVSRDITIGSKRLIFLLHR